MHRLLIVLALMLLTPVAALAAEPIAVAPGPTAIVQAPDGTIYLSHSGSYLLSVVAPNGQVRQVGVGAAPLAPALDPELQRVFVGGQADATLSAVAMDTLAVTKIGLPGAPTAVGVDLVRHRIYVAMLPDQLAIIDAVTLALLSQTKIGLNPVSLAVDQERGRVAVISRDTGTLDWVGVDGRPQAQVFIGVDSSMISGVSVTIDPVTRRPIIRKRHKHTLVPMDPGAVTLDPANGTAYVLNTLNGELVAVHGDDIVGRYRVGVRPRAVVLHNGHAYVSNWGNNTLSDVTLADGVVRETLVGYAPAAMLLDAARNRLVLVEEGRDAIAFVDLVDLHVRRVAVGRNPVALALDAGGRVFVANYKDSTLSVVEP